MQIGEFIDQHGWKALSLVGTAIAGIYTYGVYDGRQEITAVKTDVQRVETKVDTVIKLLGGNK